MMGLYSYFPVQEILAVKNDIKPVIRQGILEEHVPKIKKHLESEKMRIFVKSIDLPRLINKNRIFYQKEIIAYISKSLKTAKLAYKSEKQNDQLNLGKFLGYPECCIDFYQNKIPQPTGDEFSFNLFTFSYTNGKPSFYTNNIFNFQTKINTKHRLDIFNSFKNDMRNQLKHFLISHIPCSYRCKESIGIGKEILKLLKNEDKQFAKDIISGIKKIFLVIDDFNWVSFEGNTKGNSIFYNSCEIFTTSYKLKKLTYGNNIIFDGNKIKILKDLDVLGEIKNYDKNAKILDFS
jgi:hypothetical protein